MRKCFSLLFTLFIIIFLVSCKKKNSDKPAANETPKPEVIIQSEANVAEEQENEMAKFENNYQYVVVNSPEGIKVRDNPDLDSNRIAGLTDKTVVKLLQEGPEATIDDITANWLEIELPSTIAKEVNVKTGWVFGGYMINNLQDTVAADIFDGNTLSNPGLASVGSYIRANKKLFMYSAPSEKAEKLSVLSESDLGVIIRAYDDESYTDSYWFYILNQSNGIKGWIGCRYYQDAHLFNSTAAGINISDTRKYYTRKNADVILEKNEYHPDLGYASSISLCSDNIHFIERKNDGETLVIYNTNNSESKRVDLSYLDGYNDRESDAICYSAKSNSVYFGWDDAVYAYSIDKDKIFPVFKIDTDAPEALSGSLKIQNIYVSKDENYIFLVAEFFTGRRYIDRMIAYNVESKIQKIIDTVTPNCDSDHYYTYGDVDFDENNNAVYNIESSTWNDGTNITENAFVTVSSEPENWPNPVLHMLPDLHYSEKVVYLPDSGDLLNLTGRFCVYELEDNEEESEPRLKDTYRFAENSIYESISSYNNFQFNEDKSICAVLENKYLAFYSTKTFNLLFALLLPEGWSHFWWNGTMVLVQTEINDNYLYSFYNIKISEKENQISDNEPLTKEEVGLCALQFRCTEYENGYNKVDNGYKFYFSPGGLYLCLAYEPASESEYPLIGVIGGYEVKGDNLVHLYPSFASYYPTRLRNEKAYDFTMYRLMPDENGTDIYIKTGYPQYNRFGDIEIYDENNLKAYTYDWGKYSGYDVQHEKAASVYRIYGK